MNNDDSYLTIRKNSEGIFKDKGSKFIGLAYPISSVDEAKTILEKCKKSYHDARHHCYAYKLGAGEGVYRFNDDGEPSGTAGKPIYGQILSKGLSDILIIVVRYFGGTLLGTSGLINAYKLAALECIQKGEFVEKVLTEKLVLKFNYDLLSVVMRIVKEEGLKVFHQDFMESCVLTLEVRLNDFERIKAKYNNIYGVELHK